MADLGHTHFYLQLHNDVEDDPRIASLSPTQRDLFTRIRRMSLKGDCPGEIGLTMERLLICFGIRSPKRQARMMYVLIEERRLLKRVVEDGEERVVIARWTMPQLAPRPAYAPRENGSRPKYPSDNPEARKRVENATPQSPQSPLSEKFFNAPDAKAESVAESMRSERGVDAESNAESAQTPQSKADSALLYNSKEEKSNNNSTPQGTPHPPPQPSLTAEQNVVVATLIAEGIHPPVADRLARQGASEALVDAEIANLEQRGVRVNRAGYLRRAVEAALSGQPYLPASATNNSPKATKGERTETLRRKVSAARPGGSPLPPSGDAPDMNALRGALHKPESGTLAGRKPESGTLAGRKPESGTLAGRKPQPQGG